MSDGDFGADKATPDSGSGQPRALSANGDDVGLTAATTGTRGAAPWERFGAHSHAVAVAHRRSPPPAPTEPDDDGPRGCHTDGGLTVAELIAKIGGPTTERPRHRRAAPDPEPQEPELPQPDDGYDDAYAVSPAYAFALTDLEVSPPERRSGRADAEQTTVLPKTPARSRPAQPVNDPAADEHPHPKGNRRRHAMLLAGRLMATAIAALALALTGGAWQWSASKNHRLNI